MAGVRLQRRTDGQVGIVQIGNPIIHVRVRILVFFLLHHVDGVENGDPYVGLVWYLEHERLEVLEDILAKLAMSGARSARAVPKGA